MEARRRRSSSAATRRLYRLLALAGDYLKYLFMKRRRLLGRVARKTLALINHHGKSSEHQAPSWPRALKEHEFSCSDSPSPAFLAAKRLRSRLKLGAAAVSSCFGTPYGSPPPPTEERVEDEVEEEEEEEEEVDELDVDYRAEKFINMFYEQLRAQSFPALFQCSP